MTWLPWQDKFSEEEACRQHRFDPRWPNGLVCPKCPVSKAHSTQGSEKETVRTRHLRYNNPSVPLSSESGAVGSLLSWSGIKAGFLLAQKGIA